MTRFADTPADFADRETLLSVPGLAFMEAMRDGVFPQPPIARLMNFRLAEVSDGGTVFAGTSDFEHSNPVGRIHGGWYGTLLDSAMTCAVMTKLPPGQVCTTLEYKVNITRPLPSGIEVRAEGQVQHVGRTTGVAQGWLRGAEDGRLYATGSTTCMILAV